MHIISTLSRLVLSTVLLCNRRFSSAQFGTYKHLLTAFAITDIFLVVQHAIRTVLVGTTHGVSTDTFLDDRSVTAIYVAFQSVPFTLLIIYFLYRYLSVRHPHLLHLFKNKHFIMALGNGIVGELAAWLAFFRSERRQLNAFWVHAEYVCDNGPGRHCR
ncbi:hypothetical protein PRIPAC_82169 [Pristionchus pacificus]|uniref:G protein-coupled receptor n=1 Tax=Pristionchus pacificus TaxID=54126 RepID=A0A2A6CL21_PRIPA|nr:hypothetical protein PRIPAC_82169 [Pristionchus pacificus]|eukprot:PDM78721.1 G protein-coupled receptor [Pristionchus pacificus]